MTTVGDRSAGFTIVETLIVLAVSGVLAASAMVLVGGRQNKVEFQVAANSMKQQLEQIINETANGYYPSNGDFTCNGGTTPATITPSAPNSSKQGTNNTCIFLGKAVAFGVGNTAADPQSFIVYPLIGKRFVAGTTEVSSFIQARPQALAPNSAGNPAGIDYATNYKTKNGLSLHHAQYSVANPDGTIGTLPVSNYAVFAFADQLGQYAPQADGTISSATQKLDLFDMDKLGGWEVPPGVPASSRRVVDHINSDGIDESRVIHSLKLCLTSGGTKQSALITITGRGQLAVTLRIYGNTDCS